MTLNRIAEATQWGLITRRQAALADVPQTTMERLTAPGSVLDRVAHGVYRMAGAPLPEHLALRAAWLQLEPGVWAWERTPAQGVVSHRSAAALYGLGDLPADRHEFTLPGRKQTRRPDVRLHQRSLSAGEWVPLSGLPVTRPARIAADLLDDHEDPEGVAQIVADAIRETTTTPACSRTASPHRHRGSACAAVMASGSCAGCLTSWAILARLAGWMKPGRTLSGNRPGPAGRGWPSEGASRLCRPGGVPQAHDDDRSRDALGLRHALNFWRTGWLGR
jgi:predicted transcriptional regulator of viral defense system